MEFLAGARCTGAYGFNQVYFLSGGYGRGFGNYASIYLEDRRAQIELVVMFVVGLLAYSAII